MRNDEVKVLITGSNGLLGQKLISGFQKENIEFLATANKENKIPFCPAENFEKLDVTNAVDVAKTIEKYQPTHIINAAAMTNVDACEDKQIECFEINTKSIANFLDEIAGKSIHLIQISTDFIFDGKKKLYTEDDVANPLSIYGKSKWEAEKLIFESNIEAYTILRTSLLFGEGEALNKGNIFSWAMQELRSGKELNIVNDQFRTPTFVNDLMQACINVVELNKSGVYNIAGPELHSMYGFIQKVAEYTSSDIKKVNAISSEKLNQKAKRPLSSGLNIEKAKTELNYQPTDFMKSLSYLEASN